MIAIDHKVVDFSVLLTLLMGKYFSYYIPFISWKFWLYYEIEQNKISQNFINSKSWVSEGNKFQTFCSELVYLL